MEAVVSGSTHSSTYWRDRRVLITGATGLVGGWVLDRLLGLGADPICVVRDEVPTSRSIQENILCRSTQVRGELEDYTLLARTLNEYEVTDVLHLAAQTIVGIANASPLSTFESNIRGTWNLLEACRCNALVRSVVVASSDKAYGAATRLPYDETYPLNGTHPYDVSKSCADLIARMYFVTYGLPVAITRCGNFYGGGDLNWSRLVPGTIRSLARGHAPVIRSDGTFRRDYVYVEDAAEAYLLLAERVSSDTSVHGEAFNFSYESPLSALEMAGAITDAFGRSDIEPIILNQATNEIRDQFLDASKARRVLGWQPTFTVRTGLDRTVAWYIDYLGSGGERALTR
jgi:CDP-glucose 4,6-dehydratase